VVTNLVSWLSPAMASEANRARVSMVNGQSHLNGEITSRGAMAEGLLISDGDQRGYFPPPESQGGWRKLETPDDIRQTAGMNPAKLDELREWLLQSDNRNCAAVVIRNGYIVLEVERGNSARTDARRVASVSKAVCATVLAIASEWSQQGRTPRKMTFDDPAFEFLPWAQPLSDPRKGRITVKQLLNHTSGICPEATGAPNDGSWEYILGHTGDARTAKLAFDPGTACGYSTHALAHAALVCETVAGQPYDEFAIQGLFKPLGIEHWWFQYYDGGEKIGRHPSHGLGMPARDLARIAYCMMRDGRWDKQQVIPRWFVEETAAPTHNVTTPELRWKFNPPVFSHGWELPARHRGESGRSGEGIPPDARSKPGSGGQLIAFVPSLDLVITRQTGGSGEWEFEEYLRRACATVLPHKPGPGTGNAGAQTPARQPNHGPISGPSGPPYPHSSVIESMVWHWETHTTAALGSDLWPVAWGPDDHLYAAWGDGGGFGGSDSDGRVAMGFARIEGSPEDWRGVNVNGGKNPEHPASFPKKGKTTGLAFVDGVLYATVNLEDGPWPEVNHVLAWSTNKGATWTRADWLFPKGAGNFQPAKFLTFGRDYTGVPDPLAKYVYLYGPRQSTDRGSGQRLYLARAPRTGLRERATYEYFQRVEAEGAPVWVMDSALAQPVFADPNGVTPGSVVYHPGLKRFLLTCFHVGPGQLGVFDAPNPWGPWTTVAYYEDWGQMGAAGEGLTCGFPQKWMSADGLTLWSIFSVYGDGAKQGINAHDRFNLVKASLRLLPQKSINE